MVAGLWEPENITDGLAQGLVVHLPLPARFGWSGKKQGQSLIMRRDVRIKGDEGSIGWILDTGQVFLDRCLDHWSFGAG